MLPTFLARLRLIHTLVWVLAALGSSSLAQTPAPRAKAPGAAPQPAKPATNLNPPGTLPKAPAGAKPAIAPTTRLPAQAPTAAPAQTPAPALLPPPAAAPAGNPNEESAPEKAGDPTLPPIPLRPPSHILDESGMFPETTHKALSARLRASQTRTGIGLFLAIHTYLLEENTDQRASRTHLAWVEGQGVGIVVVHDRSTGRLSFAGSDDKRLPAADDLVALYRLADSAARQLPPEATSIERITATLTTLADSLESWQKNGRLPTPPPEVVKAPPPSSRDPASAATLSPTWKRPDSFLLDDAGVFSSAAAATALRGRLDNLKKQHGLSLYVVTVTYPPSGLNVSLAEKLALEWLTDREGGVIVFDRSRPDTLSFGGTPHPQRWLSAVQLKSIHDDALAAGLKAGSAPRERLEGAVASLSDSYIREGLPILREADHLLPSTARRIVPLMLLVAVLCAGLLYCFQRWQEKSERHSKTVFLFPEVYVPERLGAPHGGGTAAETAVPSSSSQGVLSASAPSP